MTSAERSSVESGTAIHDLGYRRYEGLREGARGAWRALYGQGLRAMFGIGRSVKAKAIPGFVIVATLLPCLAVLTASSASKGQVPIRYGTLIGQQLLMFVLFAAAQAPEVLSRDQQHKVLPLVFTRDVTRMQYGSARLAAVLTAMLLVASAPLLLLFIGEIGIAVDPVAVMRTMGSKIGAVVMQALLTAWVIGCLGAALASLTSRRAYASASIIGLFLVAAAISIGLDDLAGIPWTVAERIDPIRTLRTMAMILFDEKTRAMELTPPSALWVYALLTTALGAIGAVAMFWRIRRVHA